MEPPTNLICYSALILLLLAAAAFAADPQRPDFPTLTVTGHGQVDAKPDTATVRLGAEAQAKEAADAQQQVNKIVAAALKALHDLGLPESHLQTSGLLLFPVYDQPRPGEAREPAIVAYRAQNTLTITLDDLTKVGPALDAGVKAGANRLQGITFSLKDDTRPRQDALRQAAHDARAKADTLAHAMGVSLGTLWNVSEQGLTTIPPPFAGPEAMMAHAAGAAPTPVEPGQIRIDASLTAQYRLGGALPAASPSAER